MKRLLITYISFMILGISAMAQSTIVKEFKPVCDSLSRMIQARNTVYGELKLKAVMKRGNSLDFYFTESLGDYPWRRADEEWFKKELKSLFPEKYRSYRLGAIYSRRVAFDKFSTPELRNDGQPSSSSLRSGLKPKANPLVTDQDRQKYPKGLDNRHIALWQSHGRYYSHGAERWEWQRPCLFQTCEDMFTQGFVLPYLVPMLENAGAYTLLPRERDVQKNEVITDNDPSCGARGKGIYEEKGKWTDAGKGFRDIKTVYTGTESPFGSGTARQSECIASGSKAAAATAVWTPEIPERGEYAVYVSYRTLKNSTSSAAYTVHHLGGVSRFVVNQKMGGGTWIYLGTFEFDKGSRGSVKLDNRTPEGYKHVKGSVVTADAVRFGGGMGCIARGESDGQEACVSGLPRSAEAARYWLQWAGADSSLFHQNDGTNDYKDDFMSRGDWVEWISRGSYMNPDAEGGLGIPVDLSFGFHTDAGVTPGDSLVGTLSIYTLKSEGRQTLPCGDSRMTSREYADIVQSQIVNDLRAEYDSLWSRRQLWDRGYRESRTPSSPAMLLELLSHQNFADMKYGLDPSFRFTVSRAVYKGMLKYLSNRYGVGYAVQPLPVSDMSVRFGKDGKAVVSWKAVSDPLEPTADPAGYILYTRVNDGAFDRGKVIEAVSGPDGSLSAEVTITTGNIYSFRIAAFNEGGRSFESETVSIGMPAESDTDKTVLIVNNFDRISGPAFFDTPAYAGFDNRTDSGVPYMNDITFVGEMHEFRRDREWISNDSPGFGASYSDMAGEIVAGNTFDYPHIHGKAMMAAGYRFCSCSNEAFVYDTLLTDKAWAVDLICGKQVTTVVGNGMQQKFTVYSEAMQNAVRRFTSKGGNILVSGAYIGSDAYDSIYPAHRDSTLIEETQRFIKDVLGYRSVSGKASKKGIAAPKKNDRLDFGNINMKFYNSMNPVSYCVESPDGIAPAGKKSSTVMRYADSGISAGTAYDGEGYRTVCLGFPIETLKEDKDIENIIKITLDFFDR